MAARNEGGGCGVSGGVSGGLVVIGDVARKVKSGHQFSPTRNI
jgi:hypothetical protein